MHPGNLRVWRDHDDTARRLGPFMRLGSPPPSADARQTARDVFASGGRMVVIGESADFGALDPAGAAGFLRLLRELTSCGVAVDWRVSAGDGGPCWRDLWHLFPPADVSTPGPPAPALEFWQRQFHFGLCVMRAGPGLIEVRDRRAGRLRIHRFSDPAQLAAIERLEHGAPAASVDPRVLGEFERTRLLAALGDLRLWLPCRAVRAALSPVGFW
jgi:Family of unknown function (DUF5825)